MKIRNNILYFIRILVACLAVCVSLDLRAQQNTKDFPSEVFDYLFRVYRQMQTIGHEYPDEVEMILDYQKRIYNGDISACAELADFCLNDSKQDLSMYISILKYIAQKAYTDESCKEYSAEAAFTLGNLYSGELGASSSSKKLDNFKPDFYEAENWYNKALSLGMEKAGISLGYLNSDDRNPYKNYEKAKEYLRPWIQKEGYEIAKFEYDSACARQKSPPAPKNESISFYDKNGNLNYKLLAESAEKNNFEAQIGLAKLYLGDRAISIPVRSFSACDYSENDMANKAKKLGIKEDPRKAFEILRGAALVKNPEATLMYALMLINGVGTEKNIPFAKDILSRLKIEFSPARFYYELYFTPLEISIEKSADRVKDIVPMKDTPYTLSPKDSYEWERRIPCPPDTSHEKKYFKLPEVNSHLYEIPEGKKHLIPIKAVFSLLGFLSDSGAHILMVDPSQTNAFFVDSTVYAYENEVWTKRKDPYEYCSYELLGELNNGINVVDIYRGGSGTFVERYTCFLAMQKIENIFSNSDDSYALKTVGDMMNPHKGGLIKRAMKGNVLVAYTISSDQEWSNEKFSSSVLIISFEKDKILERQTIREIMDDLFSFRKDTRHYSEDLKEGK